MRALFLFLLACWTVSVSAQNVKTFVPVRCQALVPVIASEVKLYMPELTELGYFGALSEHESCLSLTHSRCCAPTSELKTSREQGVGISMTTRAWAADGSLRFDTLQEMKDRYRSDLKELSWLNIKQRPDLQARIMVLQSRDNYKKLVEVKLPRERLAMTDSAYNGGYGNLTKGRRACGLAKDCDPQYWRDHVARYMPQSKKPLYGNRSAYDINLHHVSDVMETRLPKYNLLYEEHFRADEPGG